MTALGVTLDDVRREALSLPRSYEALVQGRVKFRVGRIVYLAASRDETLLGFAFPKEEREALVEAEPHKFMLPKPADMRYHWAVAPNPESLLSVNAFQMSVRPGRWVPKT